MERALLDAARGLLAEAPEVPSMAAVGRRAGLARSSVYQYFGSAEELLAAVVADVFPEWGARVADRVAAAGSPAERVWAYIEANVELFASAEQAVARALTRVVEPHVLAGPMREFHARLQVPLREALADFGEPEPEAMAEHLDSLIVQASRASEERAPDGPDSPDGAAAPGSSALARLRRLLGPYLGLSADAGAPAAPQPQTGRR
nr:TetR/AcrR family transcriptional regulator [Nocardioides sp. zg-DK7169]